MTIRDIAVAFGFEVDKKSEKQAESSIRGLKNLASKLLGVIGIGFSIAGLGNLAEAAADVEALKSQFAQVFGDLEEEAAARLENIADSTGVAANRMKGSFVQIAAFAKTTGMEQAQALEISDRAMQAVADSAAFYDRSLEDVTESLQSFLKGNYENDAALGLSATETTRNAAANELYGKSFKDLDEAQKQLTLLKMVEDANKLSGAYGQAARESDTWTNQLGNLKQNLKDLKAVAGGVILQPAVAVIKMLSTWTHAATVKMQELTGEGGSLRNSFDRVYAIVQRLKPAADRMFTVITTGTSAALERFGGLKNVLKICAVAAGAFFAVMGVAKIVKLIKTIGGLTGVVAKLSKVFTVANLKVIGIIAVVALLVLIFEDFINFLMGNDSVIGTLFDKAGIGADNARQKIFEVFGAIKDFLMAHSEEIRAMFSAVWGAVTQIIKTAVSLIGAILKLFLAVAKGVFTLLQAVWSNWGTEIMNIVSTVASWLETMFNGIISLITQVAQLLEAIFSGDFSGAFQILLQIVQTIWNLVVATIQAGWQVIQNLFIIALGIISSVWNSVWGAVSGFCIDTWNGIVSFLSGIWSNIVSGVTGAIDTVKTTIVDGFTEAINWIKGLPGQALQWGDDIISGIANGIKRAMGKITDAVSGIAEKIKSFLHFSVPDEGPLTDYESWMPDFMAGLAKGIGDNEDIVLSRVRGLANNISMLINSAKAQVRTAAVGSANNVRSSVVQNVNIDNTYNGGGAEAQKNVSRAMKKSATDATTEMARALEYARG